MIDFEKLPKTVAIVGSRSFADHAKGDAILYKTVKAFVKKLHKNTLVVSGGARGIDRFAQDCAYVRKMKTKIFYPDEKIPSPKRFFARNTEIAQYLADNQPSALIAFVDEDNCNGTLYTISRAKFQGIPCVIFYFKQNGDFVRYDADEFELEEG